MRKMMMGIIMLTLLFSTVSSIHLPTMVAAEATKEIVGTPQYDINSGLYGYVNASGKWLIEPKFKEARAFSEDKAAVAAKEGVWGYIKLDGSYLITPKYSSAYSFKNGLAIVSEGFLAGVIDIKGEYKVKPEYYYEAATEPTNPYLAVIKDINSNDQSRAPKYGIITNTGVVVTPQFDGRPNIRGGFISFFKEGSSKLYQDRKNYIVIDSGKIIALPADIRSVNDGVGFIEYYVDQSLKRSNGTKRYAYLLADGRIIDSYTDNSGKKRLFVDACEFSEKLACVAINTTASGAKLYDSWGFMKKDGSWLVTPTYNQAGSFKDGVAPVKNGYTWGFLNNDGSWFINKKSMELAKNVPSVFGFSVGSYKQSEIDYVHTESKAIVSELITSKMSDYEKFVKIYDYITNNVKYDNENYYNSNIPRVSYTAFGALKYKIAVCEGYAELLNVMLNLANVKNQIIVGTVTQSGIGHAWNLVQINGVMYHVDATWDEGDSGSYSYLLRSDSYMKQSRTWDASKYPSVSNDYKR